MKITILTLGALALATPSQAAQSHDVGQFDGSYATDCVAVAMNIHLGAFASVGGASGSWGTGVTVDLSCDEVVQYDETWYQVYDDVYADCPAWLVGAEGCDQLAGDVADAYLEISNAGYGILPYELDLAVDDSSWVSRWLGLYPAGVYSYAPAGEYESNYLLDNRDGYTGNLLSAAFGVSFPWSGVGCMALGLGLVTGNIDPVAGYDLDAEFGLDGELICAAASGGDLLVFTLGLTYAGVMEGEKL